MKHSRRPLALSRVGATAARELELDWRDLLRAGLVPPIAGAEDPPDPPGDNPPPPGDNPPPPGDNPPKDDWKPPTREEFDRLQEAVASANKAKKDAERAAAAATKKDKKDSGKFEELYTEANTELERVRNVVSRTAVRDAVSDAARRLRFRNPAVAFRNIDLDGITADVDLTGDDPNVTIDQATKTLIEKRLATLADAEPYMIDPSAQRQMPGAGDRSPGGGNGNAAMNAAIRRAAGR